MPIKYQTFNQSPDGSKAPFIVEGEKTRQQETNVSTVSLGTTCVLTTATRSTRIVFNLK